MSYTVNYIKKQPSFDIWPSSDFYKSDGHVHYSTPFHRLGKFVQSPSADSLERKFATLIHGGRLIFGQSRDTIESLKEECKRMEAEEFKDVADTQWFLVIEFRASSGIRWFPREKYPKYTARAFNDQFDLHVCKFRLFADEGFERGICIVFGSF